MTPLEILKAARALITDPQHWTQGMNARDLAGGWVQFNDPTAVAWCGLGALSAACEQWDEIAYEHLLAQCQEDGGGVCNINDTFGHAYILAAYDRAIAKLEGSPHE